MAARPLDSKEQTAEPGRGYALLTLNQQDRNRRLASFNAGMGQKANEMAQLGNEMESAVEQISTPTPGMSVRQRR